MSKPITKPLDSERAYAAWVHMRHKCKNIHLKRDSYGGGRDLVCEKWNDFKQFFKDMGEPNSRSFLRRIDNNLGYCKENCRWIGIGVVELRFWNKVRKTEYCWIWMGDTSCTKWNYGVLVINGKNVRAHRISWKIHYGEIPKGYNILHKCDNTLCVRPDHLFAGTQKDNMKDCSVKGRINSKLSNEQVTEIRKEYTQNKSQTSLAIKYDVAQSTISRIIRRIRRYHVA